MDYRRLPGTGLEVSRLCLGASNMGVGGDKPYALDEAEVDAVVGRALDVGINFFDTAESYSSGRSEITLGRALKASGVERQDLVISTKVSGGAHEQKRNRSSLSRKHILNAIDESLARLQVDHVDLYTIHRFDRLTPVEETLEALHEVVKSGKARYLGASSMYAWQFEHMLSLQERHGWSRFVLMQNQYSLNYREEEREMVPLCLRRGIGMTPWGMLSAGLLAGDITREGERLTPRAKDDLLRGVNGLIVSTDQDFDIQDKVRRIAEDRGVSMAEIGMAWALSKPYVVSGLIGADKPTHVDGAVNALRLELAPDEVAFLENGYRPIFPQTLN